MEPVDITDFIDYKAALKWLLSEHKKAASSRFTFERLAQACRIHKTYLSRVLNSEGTHLSDDQLYRASQFLGLTKRDREFLFLLHSYQRSDIKERQEELWSKITTFQQSKQKSESRLTFRNEHSEREIAEYYYDPNMKLVHMFLKVRRFQNNVHLIADCLGLSYDYLTSILAKLESHGLIVLDGDSYKVISGDVTHLTADSPLFKAYRVGQKVRTLDRIQKLENKRSYNFNVVFTSSEDVREEIQKKFIKWLQEVQSLAISSEDQEVYQMSFDLFDWSL
ncbi:MAG: DUF4423 domain-containing protein [Oligoflexales bacterium]